jgi:hypothetical protein
MADLRADAIVVRRCFAREKMFYAQDDFVLERRICSRGAVLYSTKRRGGEKRELIVEGAAVVLSRIANAESCERKQR